MQKTAQTLMLACFVSGLFLVPLTGCSPSGASNEKPRVIKKDDSAAAGSSQKGKSGGANKSRGGGGGKRKGR